jgi:hypothetical protein
MKPFYDLDTIDKAQLLHELFPEEIKGLLEFMLQAANEITTAPEKIKDNWGGKPFSADGWIILAKETEHRILKNFDALIKTKRRFSDQLFDGYTAMFTQQCLQDYSQICKNSQFIQAMKLLFDL